jgi:hypothetical protein
MTEHDGGFDLHLSRRKLLAAAGLLGGAAVAGPFAETAAAEAAAGSPNPAKTPPVAGLHLQFGADASSQMVVSWHSLQPVLRPRVLLGRMDGRLEQVAPADTVSYADAKSGQVVHAHHARIGGLRPDAAYLYGALHDGAAPRFSAFRTAPRGRAPFTFTSFGDQGTPTLGRLYDPPAGVTLPAPLWVNDNLGTPSAADTMLGVERLQPLFHLFNGDLCYAISPTTGCAPGGTSGKTTAAAPPTDPGCPRPAITRTNSATARSVTAPIRPISPCRRRPARRS